MPAVPLAVAGLRSRLRELRDMYNEGLLGGRGPDEFRELKATYLRQHRQLGDDEVAAAAATQLADAAGVLVPSGYCSRWCLTAECGAVTCQLTRDFSVDNCYI